MNSKVKTYKIGIKSKTVGIREMNNKQVLNSLNLIRIKTHIVLD